MVGSNHQVAKPAVRHVQIKVRAVNGAWELTARFARSICHYENPKACIGSRLADIEGAKRYLAHKTRRSVKSLSSSTVVFSKPCPAPVTERVILKEVQAGRTVFSSMRASS